MPKKRLSMRKIREILRLTNSCNCSNREISQSCGIGSSTVSDYLHRAKATGLGATTLSLISATDHSVTFCAGFPGRP